MKCQVLLIIGFAANSGRTSTFSATKAWSVLDEQDAERQNDILEAVKETEDSHLDSLLKHRDKFHRILASPLASPCHSIKNFGK
jgi:hypothetical protein